MEKVSVIAITKNGIKIGLNLKKKFPNWEIWVPEKFSIKDSKMKNYSIPTSKKIEKLFYSNDALICLFSLGAVIRLISPILKDKKSDPAIIVIDDKSQFVISVLSGHLGGANELTNEIASKIKAIPVITTAADVNKTIAVDLIGKEFGWKIEDDKNITKVSANMINEEKIGIFQEVGRKDWWKKKYPKNISIFENLDEMFTSESKSYLIISDKIINSNYLNQAIIYRPPSLVVGVGLHWDTTKAQIKKGLEICLKKFSLSSKSISKFVSIKKPKDVRGLIELGQEMKIPVEYFSKEELMEISIPNPSKVVKKYHGTPSVSEAAALKDSKGILIVEKQKFPPNLTIAIARKKE